MSDRDPKRDPLPGDQLERQFSGRGNKRTHAIRLVVELDGNDIWYRSQTGMPRKTHLKSWRSWAWWATVTARAEEAVPGIVKIVDRWREKRAKRR